MKRMQQEQEQAKMVRDRREELKRYKEEMEKYVGRIDSQKAGVLRTKTVRTQKQQLLHLIHSVLKFWKQYEQTVQDDPSSTNQWMQHQRRKFEQIMSGYSDAIFKEIQKLEESINQNQKEQHNRQIMFDEKANEEMAELDNQQKQIQNQGIKIKKEISKFQKKIKQLDSILQKSPHRYNKYSQTYDQICDLRRLINSQKENWQDMVKVLKQKKDQTGYNLNKSGKKKVRNQRKRQVLNPMQHVAQQQNVYQPVAVQQRNLYQSTSNPGVYFQQSQEQLQYLRRSQADYRQDSSSGIIRPKNDQESVFNKKDQSSLMEQERQMDIFQKLVQEDFINYEWMQRDQLVTRNRQQKSKFQPNMGSENGSKIKPPKKNKKIANKSQKETRSPVFNKSISLVQTQKEIGSSRDVQEEVQEEQVQLNNGSQGNLEENGDSSSVPSWNYW